MAQHDEWRPPAERANQPERRQHELEPLPDWAHQLVRWLDTAVRIERDITIGLDAVRLLPADRR